MRLLPKIADLTAKIAAVSHLQIAMDQSTAEENQSQFQGSMLVMEFLGNLVQHVIPQCLISPRAENGCRWYREVAI